MWDITDTRRFPPKIFNSIILWTQLVVGIDGTQCGLLAQLTSFSILWVGLKRWFKLQLLTKTFGKEAKKKTAASAIATRVNSGWIMLLLKMTWMGSDLWKEPNAGHLGLFQSKLNFSFYSLNRLWGDVNVLDYFPSSLGHPQTHTCNALWLLWQKWYFYHNCYK